MLVDDLTVSGLLKVLREMQADKLTCDQINEISGEDLSTLVQNLSDISDKLSTIQSTIDQCETDASTFKTGIADAIKGVDSTATVTGDSSLPDFTSGIQNIVPNVTSDATATAGHILKDKTAYVNGNKVTGTIASKTAATYTPGTSNQIIAAGQYLSGAQTIAGDVDLVAENIKTGVNIFGVDGTFTSDATATEYDIARDKIAYVNGNKITGAIKTIAKDSSYKSFGSISKSSTNDKYMYFKFGDVLSDGTNGTLFRDGSKLDIYVSDHTALGTASTDKVLAGGTFTSTRGVCLTGTMNNYSGVETPRGSTANITSVVKECNIDVGGYYGIVSFHPCFTGYIDANTVINQIVYGLNPNVIKAGQLIGAYGGSGDSAITGTFTSDANASAEYILSGKTAYVNGVKVTGSMSNYNGGYLLSENVSVNFDNGNDYIYLGLSGGDKGVCVPYGCSMTAWCHASSLISYLGDASASNVLAGKTFTSSAGVKVKGTMPSYGSGTKQGSGCGIYNNTNLYISVGLTGYISNGFWSYVPFSSVADKLGITAAKIAKGQTICGVTGTYTGSAYNCRTWSYTAADGEGSSGAFTLLGGTKTLSSSSWVNSSSSSYSSYYEGQIDDLSGKISSSSFAICRVTAPTYGIRRTNGSGSYRYLKELVIFADEYLSSAGMDGVDWAGTHEYNLPSGTYIKRIRGYWLDSNRDNSSTATSSHQLVEFYITEKGYACVEFIASTTNVFAFRGPLKFEFWVFYK